MVMLEMLESAESEIWLIGDMNETKAGSQHEKEWKMKLRTLRARK